MWTNPLLFGGGPPPPTFRTTPVAQSLSPSGPYAPGQRVTCEIKFRNEGTGTWTKEPGPGYVELASCNEGAVIGTSFLNFPFDASLGWLNERVPCTFVEGSVPPGSVATFRFTGKVREDAGSGTSNVYFGPVWSGAVLAGWGKMHVAVDVLVPPPPPVFAATDLVLRNQSTGQWWARTSSKSAFTYPEGINTPPDLWLPAWAADGNGGYTYTPYAGDPDGDGFDDLLVERSDANWYISWNQGNGSFVGQGAPIKAGWGLGAVPGKYTFWFANVDGEAGDELLTYDASTGTWYVCAYDPGSRTYGEGVRWLTWGAGVGVFQPLVGDWDGDGRTDLCLRNWGRGDHYVRLSTGSAFVQGGVDNWVTWGASASSATFLPLTGDFTGDGRDDLLLYDPSLGNWWVRASSGTQFVLPEGANTPPDRFCSGWAAGSFTVFAGDFDADGKTDVGVRSPATGDHYVRISTGTRFVQGDVDNWCPGWGASPSFQLLAGQFGGETGMGTFALQAGSDGEEGAADTATVGTGSGVADGRPGADDAHQAVQQLVLRRTAGGMFLALPAGTAAHSVAIVAVTGRVLYTLSCGNGPEVLWDGCDEGGRRVPDGVYFVRCDDPAVPPVKFAFFRR